MELLIVSSFTPSNSTFYNAVPRAFLRSVSRDRVSFLPLDGRALSPQLLNFIQGHLSAVCIMRGHVVWCRALDWWFRDETGAYWCSKGWWYLNKPCFGGWSWLGMTYMRYEKRRRRRGSRVQELWDMCRSWDIIVVPWALWHCEGDQNFPYKNHRIILILYWRTDIWRLLHFPRAPIKGFLQLARYNWISLSKASYLWDPLNFTKNSLLSRVR